MNNKKPYEIHVIHGIKTVLFPLPDLPAILVQVGIEAGSWYEKDEESGAFHLIEHLTCQNTVGFSNKLAIEVFKEENGLYSNAYTGGRRMGYIMKGPDYSLAQAIHLLNQEVFQPNITEERLPKEISIITQEYKDHWDRPNSRFGRVMDEQIYGKNHPYTKNPLGEIEAIKKLSVERLKELHREYYQPENMVITVTGKFDIEECRKILEQVLTPIDKIEIQKIKFVKPKIGTKVIEHRDDVTQRIVSLRWPVPGTNDLSMKERYTFGLGTYILGGSPRSRLFLKLREEKGLVYRTSAGRSHMPMAGYFEAWCSTDDEKSEEALESMREVIYEFAEGKMRDDQFNRAKRYLLSRYPLIFDSIDSISDEITNDIFLEKKIYMPEDSMKIMESITKKDVEELMSKYLKPEKELVAIMRSK